MISDKLDIPFIRCPESNHIFHLFDSLIEQNEMMGTEPCMLIVGETGSGKTGLAKQYCKMHPPVDEMERRHIPVLYVALQKIKYTKDIYEYILMAIGDPQRGVGKPNETELRKRLGELSRTVGLKMLILDEVQTTIERRSQNVLSTISDTFKDIIIDLKLPVVMMGLPWARYLLDANPQLNDRVDYRYLLQSYRISDNESFSDFQRLLKLLGDYYGVEDSVKLEQKDISLRLFSYSSGNRRKVIRLIAAASFFATKKREKLNLKWLSHALEKQGVREELNVFKKPLQELTFRELADNSDWLLGAKSNESSLIEQTYITYSLDSHEKLVIANAVA